MRPQSWRSGAKPDFALSAIAFAPVIPNPDKIICVGINYRDHVAETGRTVTEKPALFARFAGSQVGHLQPMIKPKVSDQFDYEGEIAVVIGKGGRHIAHGRRAGAISPAIPATTKAASATGSATPRQFLAGKNFAGTGAFGPWLVTSDEIPDPTQADPGDPPQRPGGAAAPRPTC